LKNEPNLVVANTSQFVIGHRADRDGPLMK
jgi:hypothetical protein